MIDDKQIKKWVHDGTITKTQAIKMLEDVKTQKKETRSNNFITILSTIGVLLLGFGSILLIASNWQAIPDFLKILLLLASTFGSYYTGYRFKYQDENLPRVGSSLLFLGALLFGTTVILVTQIYNIPANSHVLVLLWLIGIFPLVYVLKNKPIAVLASLLLFIWIPLFFERVIFDFFWFLEALSSVTVYIILHITSLALFAFGGLHYFRKDLVDIARVYRITALQVFLTLNFILTFRFFSSNQNSRISSYVPEEYFIQVIILIVLTLVMILINWFMNKSKKISPFEGPAGIAITLLTTAFYFFPSSTNIYVFLFNAVMLFMIGLLIYLGYDREDMRLVNTGVFWLSLYIIVRYFDFFWDLMPRSLFFILGGLLLVFGGISLEKKRRQLKQEMGA